MAMRLLGVAGLHHRVHEGDLGQEVRRSPVFGCQGSGPCRDHGRLGGLPPSSEASIASLRISTARRGSVSSTSSAASRRSRFASARSLANVAMRPRRCSGRDAPRGRQLGQRLVDERSRSCGRPARQYASAKGVSLRRRFGASRLSRTERSVQPPRRVPAALERLQGRALDRRGRALVGTRAAAAGCQALRSPRSTAASARWTLLRAEGAAAATDG